MPTTVISMALRNAVEQALINENRGEIGGKIIKEQQQQPLPVPSPPPLPSPSLAAAAAAAPMHAHGIHGVLTTMMVACFQGKKRK